MTNSDQKGVDLDIDLPASEVMRSMGCGQSPEIRPEYRVLIDRLLLEARAAMKVQGVYIVRDVERMTDHQLVLHDCPPFNGSIAGFLKAARRVAVFVTTIGNRLERLVDEWINKGELLEGYTLNAIGSVAADAASDAMTDYFMEYEAGPDEAVTAPFSPGYCGISLEEQKTLFSIVDASPIGVKLRSSMFMEPIKSVSGMVGIGHADEIIARGVPCQWCEMDDCKMRRQ